LTFVEGFEAAPTDRMSASALAGETLEDDEQFRIPGGYSDIVAALTHELPQERVTMVRNATVTRIAWQRGKVGVKAGGRRYEARAAVVTLPLGVLQARSPQRGAVTFVPPLREKQAVVQRMGVGQVIRIVLRFDARRWKTLLPETLRRSARGGFGFIHSRTEGVPVWWGLSGAPVLTGWAGGPAAATLAHRSKRGVFDRTLSSLSEIFGRSKRELRAAVRGWETHNWSRDPFSRGAYSFTAAGADDAAEKLRAPVRDTLFFAGEATADGEEVGTVHGALSSGLRAAEEAAKALRRKP
jgi:monoamine oxidase